MIMRNQNSGFTLIELLIVVTILGVLAAIGTPSLQFMIATYRLKTFTSDMHTMLNLARSEAIKRNSNVTITPANASDWSMGWSLQFGSQLIATQDPYQTISISTRNAAFGAKTVASITYTGTGRENSTDGVAFVATSTSVTTLTARCIVLDPSGRPTFRVDKDGNPSNGCN